MVPTKPVQSGKKYLFVRCNGVSCYNILIYSDLPGTIDTDIQDELERQYRGQFIECSNCHQQTKIYEGLALFVR